MMTCRRTKKIYEEYTSESKRLRAVQIDRTYDWKESTWEIVEEKFELYSQIELSWGNSNYDEAQFRKATFLLSKRFMTGKVGL